MNAELEAVTLADGISLLRLRLGDRLAIRVPSDVSEEDAGVMLSIVRDRWPGIGVVMFAGDVELAVIRSDDEDDGSKYDSWGEDA